ncbi:MAG: Gfo/Idh/MocA family oxidoreductase [Candidatus Eisenbacteria bacterium]
MAWDPDADRLALAASIGAEPLLSRDSEEVAEATTRATRGRGADQVILAASAGPAAVASAALATRRHGVLVLLGLTPVSVPREIAYERELDLRMSTSYGPGRYDPEYEERGRDYPFAHVRWTEGRNVEAYLELLARGRISLDGLFEQIDGLEKAAEGYARLRAKGAAPGLIFRYEEGTRRAEASPAATSSGAARSAVAPARGPTAAPVRVAVLGVGGYTANSILPELARLEGRARLVLLAGSVPARREPLARAHKFERTSERYEDAAVDPAVELVVIATRHDRHAALIERALAAGRAVFCEKPLALTAAEIERIASALAARADAFLTLGFNRRFAPTVVRWREELRARRGPLHLDYRVQAGPLPEGHWLRTAEGGGRLLGEAVHMIDLLRHLVGQPLEAAQVMGGGSGPDRDPGADNFQLMLRYRDGSTGSLLYTSRGSNKHPKERIEGHWDGRTIELDDFTALREAGRNDLLWSAPRADKGQRGLWSACLDALLRGAPSPTPSDELLETARAAVALDAALRDAP